MKKIEEQLKIIESLIGKNHKITVKEDGFLSRGFVVDNGIMVFKFPRNKDVSYKTEIENLNFLSNLNLNVNTQKVSHTSLNDEYLGIYGVLGKSLEKIELSKEQETNIGMQLGEFLQTIHSNKTRQNICCLLSDEISAWQKRVKDTKEYLNKIFSQGEQQIINKLFFEYMPKKLNQYGEKLVYSHGDLGDGNIIIDDNGIVGIIDFNEAGLLDEAGDFMDIQSDYVCSIMLDKYGADETLRKKVELRRDIRPFIVLKAYLQRSDQSIIQSLIQKIRTTIKKYSFLNNI